MTENHVGVTRAELIGLLSHFGWELVAENPVAFDVWVDHDRDVEILVPNNATAPDYLGLLRRARNSLVHEYGHAFDDVLDRLKFAVASSLEVARWRKASPYGGGAIGWVDGESLILDARAQLAASAKSAVHPRRYHGNSGSFVASEFLAGAMMGQTDVGSFIVNALIPVDRPFHISKAASDRLARTPGLIHQEPDLVTGRQILETFESAVRITRDVLDQFKSEAREELFAEAVSDGVSSEFVRALGNSLATGDLEVEVVKGDPGTPGARRSSVAFEAVDAGPLGRASNFLAQTAPASEVTLEGKVTLLSRDDNEAVQVIRLQVARGAAAKSVRVRLSAEQYEVALTAHHDRKPISVQGTLERDGQYFWLYGAADLSVLATEEVGPGKNTINGMGDTLWP